MCKDSTAGAQGIMRIVNEEDGSQDIFHKSYKLSDMSEGKFQVVKWFMPHKVQTVM
jgi:hypothetical protein